RQRAARAKVVLHINHNQCLLHFTCHAIRLAPQFVARNVTEARPSGRARWIKLPSLTVGLLTRIA
ncbi:MAG: hypothetical protein ACXW3F_17165, partial [Pyrinomonadaceae bacterium]